MRAERTARLQATRSRESALMTIESMRSTSIGRRLRSASTRSWQGEPSDRAFRMLASTGSGGSAACESRPVSVRGAGGGQPARVRDSRIATSTRARASSPSASAATWSIIRSCRNRQLSAHVRSSSNSPMSFRACSLVLSVSRPESSSLLTRRCSSGSEPGFKSGSGYATRKSRTAPTGSRASVPIRVSSASRTRSAHARSRSLSLHGYRSAPILAVSASLGGCVW